MNIWIWLILYWIGGFFVWKKIDYDTLDVGQVELRKPSYKSHLCNVQGKDIVMSLVVIPVIVGLVAFLLGCFIRQEIRFKNQKQRWKSKG